MQHVENPQSPSFPAFVENANALGFKQVVLLMSDPDTGLYCIRTNVPTDDAIVLMENVADKLLDERAKEMGVSIKPLTEGRQLT